MIQEPEIIMTITQEIPKGYRYAHPIERIYGKTYYEHVEESHERQNWGAIYWQNHKWDRIKEECRYDDPYWDSNQKEIAFEMIRKAEYHGVAIRFFDFEIWLMNNGFTIESWGPSNAYNPGITLAMDKGTPLGFKHNRYYEKKDKRVVIQFGLFDTHKHFFHFGDQFNAWNIPHKDFDKAVNGELTPYNYD